MGHSIQGIILRAANPTPGLDRIHCAVKEPLQGGLVFVPLSYAMFDEIVQEDPARAANPFVEFEYLAQALLDLVVEQSRIGPVAYIETDYFGGVGEQAAAAWDQGKIMCGPDKAAIGPINAALQALGVSAQQHCDLFDAVGLQHHRSMDRWNYPDPNEDEEPTGTGR